jgi:hypothetical protein
MHRQLVLLTFTTHYLNASSVDDGRARLEVWHSKLTQPEHSIEISLHRSIKLICSKVVNSTLSLHLIGSIVHKDVNATKLRYSFINAALACRLFTDVSWRCYCLTACLLSMCMITAQRA